MAAVAPVLNRMSYMKQLQRKTGCGETVWKTDAEDREEEPWRAMVDEQQ
jgi:hypothetical protein